MKKWFEGKKDYECKKIPKYKLVAQIHKTLTGLTEQVVQTTKKTEILDNLVTFCKDLVFGLLYIFTSILNPIK